MDKIAILVDGGFYRQRAYALYGEKSAQERVKELITYCMQHVTDPTDPTEYQLYRIFYYDCPPASKKVFHPLLNRTIDMGKTDLHIWMNSFLDTLKGKRKVALRLGSIAESQAHYILNAEAVKNLYNGKLKFEDIKESDFTLNMTQKGVDMKIGIDIASLAYKKQVNKIVLISGDSDFVPAAKLARREGIDFVLDPMWVNIKPELFEHIDGLKTHAPKPKDKIINKKG